MGGKMWGGGGISVLSENYHDYAPRYAYVTNTIVSGSAQIRQAFMSRPIALRCNVNEWTEVMTSIQYHCVNSVVQSQLTYQQKYCF